MKKTVLCIFSLVLYLLVACTILCAEIEDTMMTHAIVKQESGMEFEVKLQPSSIFEDMKGKHLYELTEGVGWNTGIRASEVPESYYNPETLSCSSFGKWEYIMSASRQPREGERIMVWALQRDIQTAEDDYLLIYPNGVPDFEWMLEEELISEYQYEKVMSEIEITAENELSMLVHTQKGKLPYTEQMAKTDLSALKDYDWRIYRIGDIEQLFKSLPLIAILIVAVALPIVIWAYTCVLVRKEDENERLIKINAGIIAGMLVVLLILMKAIDLPPSLMPLDNIFDMAHYNSELTNIFFVLKSLGTAGQSVITLAGQMKTLFYCLLAAGAAIGTAFVVVEGIAAKKNKG